MRQPRSTSLVGQGPRDEDTGPSTSAGIGPVSIEKLTTLRDQIARDFSPVWPRRSQQTVHEGVAQRGESESLLRFVWSGQIAKRCCRPSVNGGRVVTAVENRRHERSA